MTLRLPIPRRLPRWIPFGVGLVALAVAVPAGATCRLAGAPWLEGSVVAKGGAPGKLARAVDAHLGETVRVFLAAPLLVDGKRLVASETPGAGRVPFSAVAAACGAPRVAWRRVEPRMEHVETPAPNKDIAVYSNAVIFGEHHGQWIGFDQLEYVETPLETAGTTPVADFADAQPSAATGATPRDAARARLGVMRLAATLELAGQRRSTPGADDARLHAGLVTERVFRYTVRAADDFLGWLGTFYNVPYLFGSAGKGARNQAERYQGADCADVLVAALRKAGHRELEYSSVAGLVDALGRVGGPSEVRSCVRAADPACRPLAATPPLRWGTDVRPGDLIALDYIDADELPRDWDHIVAAVEDRGPPDATGAFGPPDGLLGPEDLVIDTGDHLGLKVAPLGDQGHVRVAVLRPRTRR